ncbi:MAG: ankyrin repeat domain-containing protein [Candidatus Babeliales bacterium]
MLKKLLTTGIIITILSIIILQKDATHIQTESAETTSYSSLWDAVMNGSYEEVEQLLATGINVNDYEGESALHAAAQKGDLALAKLLLEHGADVHAKSYEAGWTPLHQAAAFGHLALLELLVAHGANVQEETQPIADNMYNAFETPLPVACRAGHLDVVQFLVEHGVTLSPEESYAPLYNAVASGNSEIVAYLLAKGADCRNYEQNPPLLVEACMQEHIEIVKLLAAHGYNIDAQDQNGQTPLIMAVQGNHKELVAYLLEHNADIAREDDLGYTALSYAREQHNTEIENLLLAKGVLT